VERALEVRELPGAHELAQEVDLDAAQPLGGDVLEAAAPVDERVRAGFAEEDDVIRRAGCAGLERVADRLGIQRLAGDAAGGEADALDELVLVADGVLVQIADLDERPLEDVAGRGPKRCPGDRAAALGGAAEERSRAGLVDDLPPVAPGIRAVADDLAEAALDARVEDLDGLAAEAGGVLGALLDRAAMRDRRELLAVEPVGLGLEGAVVARGAKPRVDRDGADRQIPADAHPAVAARRVVREAERRREAAPAGRQVEGIAERRIAARAWRRRVDERDARAGVGRLDAAQRVGVELAELGVLGRDDDRVDHRREVVAGAVDDVLLVVDLRAGEPLPALGRRVEVVGVDVVAGVPGRQERRVVGQEDVEGPFEQLAVRQKLEGVCIGRCHVDEPRVERRDVGGREVLDRDIELGGDGSTGDVDADMGADPDRRHVGLGLPGGRLHGLRGRLPGRAEALGLLGFREAAGGLGLEAAALVEHERPCRLRAVGEARGHGHRPGLVDLAGTRQQAAKRAVGRAHVGGLDLDRHRAAERARPARPAVDPGDEPEMLRG
jgi:hypothetical protein